MSKEKELYCQCTKPELVTNTVSVAARICEDNSFQFCKKCRKEFLDKYSNEKGKFIGGGGLLLKNMELGEDESWDYDTVPF